MPRQYATRTVNRYRSQRGDASQSWYKSKRWRRMRARQLDAHPLCQCPHCTGNRTAVLIANVVDHIKPHGGDRRVFWDANNLRSMNKACHDKFKQSQEQGGHGFMSGCDASGQPLSKDHPWYG